MTDAASQPAETQWFWDRYWQADRLAACLVDPATGNYEPAIRDAWEQFFTSLADGARLLDIGTGNGAVAVIAFESAARTQRQFEIHGVDRADIDPARFTHATPAVIRFHARTPAESLPFPAAHFDAITGQYALEYTDIERSLRELSRVAKPGARLHFILHARGARPVNAAAAGLDDILYAMDTLRILDKARALMRAAFAFERAERRDAGLEAEARTARENYLVAARALDERYSRSTDQALLEEMLGGVRYAWDHRREFTLDYILAGTDAIETEVRAHRARLENMCTVALTRAGAEALCRDLSTAGFENISLNEFRTRSNEDFWGWQVTARQGRPSARAARAT